MYMRHIHPSLSMNIQARCHENELPVFGKHFTHRSVQEFGQR